jgi:EAL domain-containing protein (putative c-di-GMP-specific phosphodiesterase class I)
VQFWPAGLKIGLNVSAAQLTDESIVEDVRSALEQGGIAPGRIVLEVTETFAVHDLARAKETLQRLADLGVRLALDDFGTGYSSLTHAQALPFDILKIDRSFVAAAGVGDRGAVATISAVAALAQRLQVDVVAEGVEDLSQLAELRRMGCAFAQGFALARPLTPVQVDEALAVPGPWVLPQAALPLPRSEPATVPS